MAIKIPLQQVSIAASADLSAKQFLFVKVDGAGRIAVAGAADHPCGVLQNKPAALDRAATVMTFGITPVVAGGIVTAGDRVRADAAGKAATAAVTEPVAGIALASAVLNDVFSVLLCVGGDVGQGLAVTVKVSANDTTAGYLNGKLVAGAGTTLTEIDDAGDETFSVITKAQEAYMYLSVPFQFAKIADGDIVTDFTTGVAGEIDSWCLIVTDPVTTANDLSDLHLEIGAVSVTGGLLEPDSTAASNVDTLGIVLEATAVTAANVIAADSVISIVAANTVAFAEGEGVFIIRIKPTTVVS